MPGRVLITGASGFVGQWLSRAMLESGWTVFAGTIDDAPASELLSAKQRAAIRWLHLNVASEDDVVRAVEESAPDRVVHLAGIASPLEANASPLRTFDVNALGAMRLLNHLASSASNNVRVLVVGSAEQYGVQDGQLSETDLLLPLSPYGSSKAAQELIALQISRRTGLQVVCTRSFNHSGLGHGETYLLPALVRRSRELPKTGGKLQIGNGSPIRDYLHVADVVDAYVLLLEKGVTGEVYNVCSGEGTTVRELAERVLARAGVAAEIMTDPTLVRPVDVPKLVGDNRKLRDLTGWKPRRSVDDIIDDLIHAAPR
jgi:GDP-4-dehydro-6-deoxy-D-mannose reductase